MLCYSGDFPSISSEEWYSVANNRVSRRNLLTTLAGGATAACVPFEGTSPFWGTIGAGFRSGEGASIDPAYVQKLPYASMLAWFEGGPKALVVLGEVAGNHRLNWYSKQKQVITTYGPFVVGAIGFDIDLRGTTLSAEWTPNPLELVGRRLTRAIDVLAEGERVQVALASKFKVKERERIEILGVERQLQHVVEEVSHEGRARYRNDYWVDATTGRCWKSRQITMPTLPPMNLEVTKYPSV